jgi:hypothetical protein
VQPAGFELAIHQLPQIQRIAAGSRPQPACGSGVHWAAELRFYQGGGLVFGQWLQFQPGQVAVFPQCGHRIRRGFTGAHGDDQRRGLA